MEENRISDTAAEESVSGEELIGSIPEEDDAPVHDTFSVRGEREEYEFLIKNRFKDFYAEDTQKLINRRFRKYKMMEERYKLLEEQFSEKETQLGEYATRVSSFENLLKTEVEKAIRETEERVIEEINIKRSRPSENGTAPTKTAAPFDVTKLTKSQRATLAKRAAGGEKIKFN